MTFPELKTDRLRLRMIEHGDLDRLVQLANSYEVAGMLSGMPYPFTEEYGQFYINRGRNNDPDKVVLWAVDDGSGLIGCIWARFEDDQGWTGYWLGEAYWGRGYMTEALRTVLRFGFEKRSIVSFEAGVFRDNPASARLLDKMGFSEVGEETIPSNGRGGTMVPHVRLALPKAEFVDLAKAEGCPP
ncbi:N-acetyltransferase [Pseudovibrio japonicus]|uniref:N-acetyltransferase n=1 Tax=Pseudovibrio japonicus TaxID=366534 RepID=A0ABQ3E316_9HYPH|nr:GNAT family protein [Pseudovibrio japonicus]GHB24693.1 N-acetyltransferase [Pseudovibrio japonicus]